MRTLTESEGEKEEDFDQAHYYCTWDYNPIKPLRFYISVNPYCLHICSIHVNLLSFSYKRQRNNYKCFPILKDILF